MTGASSQDLGLLARLALALAILLIVAGVVWHGVTLETLERLWRNLVERPTGPMNFRFVLQPSVAAALAVRDGRKDARTGRSPYFVTVLRNAQERAARLREGVNATARIILLGLAMDLAYQILVLQAFHPNEAVIVVFLLAFVPYLVIRGLATRVWRARAPARGAR
jgi:hypothetical protein